MTGIAIVIGIDRYATELESLTGAVADAHAFALWLVRHGGLSPDDVRLGLEPHDGSPDLPAELGGCRHFRPDIVGINKVLADLRDGQSAPLDILYFYFSGHGASALTSTYVAEAICLAGFTAAANHLALDLQSVRARLNAVTARQRFVFIDGCRDQVYSEDIQFARLANARPVPLVMRNFELRATPQGRKAAERAVPGVGYRGLFSRHLVDGLHGAGAAKRWDGTVGGRHGAYVVRWDSLCSYVRDKVGGSEPDQLVTRSGEHPAGEDPLFAKLDPAAIDSVALEVVVARPQPCPSGAILTAMRMGDTRPASLPLPATGALTLAMPPSDYVLSAECDGFEPAPVRLAVALYEPTPVQLKLVVTQAAPAFPGGLLPIGRSSPSLGSPPGTDQQIEAAAWDGPAGQRVDDRPPSEPPHPSETGSTMPLGTLELSIGGKAPAQINPPLQVTIRSADGGIAVSSPLPVPIALPAGSYRVRAETPDGHASEGMVAIGAHASAALDLAMPGACYPAVGAALARTGNKQHSAGVMLPSESLGPLASSSLSTVAIVAVAQAVHRYRGELAELGLGSHWIDAPGDGVQVVMCEDLVDPDAWAVRGAPNARLWGMYTTNHGFHGRLIPDRAGLPLSGVSLPARPGGYWLELEDADRRRRSGFKLATTVFKDHVTLVLRHVGGTGALQILQMAVPRPTPSAAGPMHPGSVLVQAEAFQRARADGRDPLTLETARDLVEGRWFEPFSAFVLGAALAGRADEDATARRWFGDLIGCLPALPDSVDALILRAIAADLSGDPRTARDRTAAALGLHRAPVVDRLLDPFAQNLDRFGLRGAARDWLAEKRSQAIGHPLWTMRREDDRRSPPS